MTNRRSTLFVGLGAFAAAVVIAPDAGAKSTTGPVADGNPQARRAAQRGLDYLAKSTIEWQRAHKCYGCHVQAVTLEAMAVGVHHSYRVPKKAIGEVLEGLLHSSGGARKPFGLSHMSSNSLLGPSKSFGGAAFARYDQHVSDEIRPDLMKVAEELLSFQNKDGTMKEAYNRPPVAAGDVNAVYHAVQTWRQAFARSADDRWLAPIRRAERYLLGRAQEYTKTPPANIQDLNYAILGLANAGVGDDEQIIRALTARIRERQGTDGGWGYAKDQAANALATGQTVHALRLIGLTDNDTMVSRGTKWLVDRQRRDGSWSDGGFGKAEAMWGVLGLVSVDVVTIDIAGVRDGQHVHGKNTIHATAADNQGGAIRDIQLYVDDVLVKKSRGAKLTHEWITDGLKDGLHVVDVHATNGRGQTGRRRLAVYAGDHYLTEIGSRFEDNGTLVSMRNIAPDATGSVRLSILGVEDSVLFMEKITAEPGPVSFYWNGKDTEGNLVPRGRYVAELVYLGANGKARQRERHIFTHDTLTAERATFGQIQGRLSIEGEDAAAPTTVELLDERGEVVQRVQSTGTGSYRFKNVDRGKYKLRVKKKGFKDEEVPVSAAPAAEAVQSMSLKRR